MIVVFVHLFFIGIRCIDLIAFYKFLSKLQNISIPDACSNYQCRADGAMRALLELQG